MVRLMRENNVQFGPEVDKYVSEHDNLARTLKPEAARVISYLHSINITSIMVTGDDWATVAASAMEVGVDKVYAETVPLGKADRIKELQLGLYNSYRGSMKGMAVVMMGDGINDSGYGCRNLGMAIGAGTDVAIEAAYSSDEEQLGRCSYSH
ncbi:copper-transporting ATPase HMA4-like [Pyrus communis]|uniref:copper-transporting ATPase HMA4-like n=1 Tax=Pyrus communis TaxID=23211 RepID=UPI0035C0F7AE